MIVEHHHPGEDSIALPTVQAYARFPICPKCGYQLGAGIRFMALWRLAKGENAQRYLYCKGDCNSTVQVPGLNLQTGEMRGIDMPIPCFGVFQEHLHCACGRCGFGWLMDVKGSKRC
jgi:hypothetical protein